MKLKILNLVRDEKFILFIDGVFSYFPGVESRYIVVSDEDVPFKYISGLNVWRQVDRWYFSSKLMKNDLAWADCFIAHFLDYGGARMILAAPTCVTTVWSGWGRDYYHYMPGGESMLLGKDTRRLIKNLDLDNGFKLGNSIGLLKSLAKSQLVRLAAFKVNFFSAPIASDFLLLKRALGKRFKAKYVQLNYGSLEQTSMHGLQYNREKVGDDILIGNSSTPLNNHIEAFRFLSEHDLGDRKVVVPLSYGSPEYRDAVIVKGKVILGERFEPIVQFLPLGDYNRLISQCSFALMNNRRQMAVGNIVTMLYCGAKIFFDERNPTYDFFKEKGAYIYSMKLFRDPFDDLFEPLDTEQIDINKEILESYWADDVVLRNASDLLYTIRSNQSKCS